MPFYVPEEPYPATTRPCAVPKCKCPAKAKHKMCAEHLEELKQELVRQRQEDWA